MSETPFKDAQNSDDELLDEYQFDYQKAKPNRFARDNETPRLTVVVLDEDVAKVFKTPESVNKVLRALIESMPQTPNSETA
ncbi:MULTISPECIES: hypothetical protein [Calothrix]|uniref:Uncharacterized protein n=2 Tax=Calothrix TaxID=1186 RepID=A0ABR8A3R6_9CYAN|nr:MULTISPECIES: hypothetical protein [Calothrix]MBD2194454.1 hypothetical protein [Calothrix parietina FACHB-288]MBD2223236.1 hypothetical protein [Calothrix anomala FACHB-343]